MKNKTVLVILPTIREKKALEIAKTIKDRANYPCDVLVVLDKKKTGWVATLNATVKKYKYDYYVYAADDVFPGKRWLEIAMNTAKIKNAGLVALNGGKWFGALADFGLVERKFMLSNYGGDMLYSGYKSHYGDVELTILAKAKDKYAYSATALFVEVHDKTGYENNRQDQKKFRNRKKSGFNGKVKDRELLNQYS